MLALMLLAEAGCARLFGWEVHAPGLLSASYLESIEPLNQRVALYLPNHLLTYVSKAQGGRFADPQTYHIGEAFAPMLVEAFQRSFDEFVLIEVEPTPGLMRQYAIPHLVVVDVAGFHNRVGMKGQAVQLDSAAGIFDENLNRLERFKAVGASDAQRVFAKKGGPEVNLNAAVEHNVQAVMNHVRDFFAEAA